MVAPQEATTQTVVYLENNPHFNAGRGSVLDTDGNVSMDASFVEGKNKNFGGVINVKHVKNPIILARKLAEYKEHNLISGLQAELFAKENDLEFKPMDYFITDYRKDQLTKNKIHDTFSLDHFTNDNADKEIDGKFGTVGAVALDQHGNLSSATSTGGITNKKYGRVGDTPILGAGCFADNETLAVSATGRGEVFTNHLVCHEIHCLMKYKELSLAEASNIVIENVLPKNSGGIIAIDKWGNISMPFNTDVMFRAAAGTNLKKVISIE